MARDEIVLNAPRKPIKGKLRSLEFTTEPILHTFDDKALGEGPAGAIKDKVQREILGITETAAASTLAKRRKQGISATRLFNATGRLVKGLFVSVDGDSYETRTPSDRFTGETAELLPDLLELVDIAPEDLVKDRKVAEAIGDTLAILIKKGRKIGRRR